MNVIRFEPRTCRQIRELLDSYVSNELLVETNHEVLKHLASCPVCSHVLEDRVRVKQALRNAVLKEEASPALRKRIRDDLRRSDRGPANVARRSRWAFATAAALVILATGWGTLWLQTGRSGDLPSVGIAAKSAPAAVETILEIGARDHVHCTLHVPPPLMPATLEQMMESVGPEYAGLVPMVNSQIPGDFAIVDAHRCTFDERVFIHLVYRRGEELLSLVVTRKRGESFSRDAALRVVEASDVPLYGAHLSDLEVTGFETPDHLAFVVSGLASADNTRIASALAPPIRDYLHRLDG